MKRVIILLTTAALLLVAALSGCQPKDLPDESSVLSLSETNLTLSSAEQSAPGITITTNAQKCTAFAGADWIEATISGSTLTISVEANKHGTTRKAQVLVTAGSANEVVSVTQGGADVMLDLSIGEKTVSNKGGNFLIALHGNADDWKVELDDTYDWITVTKFEDFVSVDLEPNTSHLPRAAKVFISSGTHTREVAVTQSGLGSKYPVPYLKRFIHNHALLQFEREQGNEFLYFLEGGNNAGQVWPVRYAFALKSDIFKECSYGIVYLYDELQFVSYRLFKGQETLRSEDFKLFLKDLGFTLEDPDEIGNYRGSYSDKDGLWEVIVNIFEEQMTAEESVVEYRFTEQQHEDYKTFDSFPYDVIEYLRNPEILADDIISAEEEAGSKIVRKVQNEAFKNYVRQLYVQLDESQKPKTHRIYQFDRGNAKASPQVEPSGELSSFVTIYSDWSLAYWKTATENFNLTREFKALLEDSGFEYYDTDETGMNYYLNYEKGVIIAPTFGANPVTGEPGLGIYYLLDGNSSGTSKSVYARSLMDRLSAEISGYAPYFKPIHRQR